MKTMDRLKELQRLFINLSNSEGRLYKESLVRDARKLDEQLDKDITYSFEILTGQHKINFKFNADYDSDPVLLDESNYKDCSLEELVKPIMNMKDHSVNSILSIENMYRGLGIYLNPLLNREWRLGINKSQLTKLDISPMLAKKFSYEKLPGTAKDQEKERYYITEKLDGNRCIAKYNYDTMSWEFYARSGKKLKVAFFMSELPKEYIYDGEILSEEQLKSPSQTNFNALSGRLNSKYGNKDDLVYMIFDIVNLGIPYISRRAILDGCKAWLNPNCWVKILPVLKISTKDTVFKDVAEQLEIIENKGGEGVMVNLGYRCYENKRTDALLKVKSTYTMDMEVIDVIPGTGKNEGLVGSLECIAKDSESNLIFNCKVGSGIKDYQRTLWMDNPDKIVGKIVEIAYFSYSQSKESNKSNVYSLRFPRLKRVRVDKNTTSVY